MCNYLHIGILCVFQCYLGDAFRCDGCPHTGKPAFKPGNKIVLHNSTLSDAWRRRTTDEKHISAMYISQRSFVLGRKYVLLDDLNGPVFCHFCNSKVIDQWFESCSLMYIQWVPLSVDALGATRIIRLIWSGIVCYWRISKDFYNLICVTFIKRPL